MGRLVIREGCDEELDNMKHKYRGMESFLDEVTRYFTEKLRAETQMEFIVKGSFLPQIGFLLAIPLDEHTGGGVYEGDLHDPWERIFTTEGLVHYKNAAMREMDDRFGDVQ